MLTDIALVSIIAVCWAFLVVMAAAGVQEVRDWWRHR